MGPLRRRTSALVAALLVAALSVACSNKTPRETISAQRGLTPGQAGDGHAGTEAADPTLGGAETGVAGPSAATGGGGPTGGTAQAGRSTGARAGGPGGGGGPSGGGGGSSGARGGSTVGVTNDTVRISVSAPFTGTYAPIAHKTYVNGFQVWAREVNAKGGIHGRKIELVQVDNRLAADGAIAACKEAKSNGTFMVLNYFGQTAEDDCEDAAGVPVFDVAPSYLKPWKNVIALYYLPGYAETEVSFFRSPYMNAADKRFGIVTLADRPLQQAEAQAVTDELKRRGMQVAHTEKVAANQASFVVEMQRMRDAKVDVILLYVSLEGPGIIRDARAVGLTNVLWYSGPNGASTDVSAQAGREEMRDVKALRYITTTETPAYQQYLEKVRRYQSEQAASGADTIDATGYAMGEIVGHILEAAGRNLTRERFVATAKATEGYRSSLVGMFVLKGKPVPVGQDELYPIICCNNDFTYKTLGPPAARF